MTAVTWSIFDVVEIALLVVVYVWVGKRPTAAKVSALIVIYALCALTTPVLEAASNGMSLYDWELKSLEESLEAMGNSLPSDQRELFSSVMSTVAGCLPALELVNASATVFAVLCIRWIFDRVRHKSQWSAFSKVDLSIWWVIPLVAGIVMYIVSLVAGIPARWQFFVAAMNVLIAALVPLFVQGAACCKGIINRTGLRLAWQLVVGFFALVTGVAFIVLPIVGLVDFWANFRKLPREDREPAQRRLPH